MNTTFFVLLALWAFVSIACAKNIKNDERDKTRKKRLTEIGATFIEGAISAGETLISSSIDGAMDATKEPVSVGILVENWTKYMLRDPIVHLKYGHVSEPAKRVLPSQEELMVAHKAGSTYGSGGVMSYYISEIDRRIYIMWMVTNNQYDYNNWLAVGIDDKNKDYRFHAMYYDNPTTFVRGKYWDDIGQISYTASGITVEGVIGSAMKCKATIIVKPTSKANLAEKVKELITERL